MLCYLLHNWCGIKANQTLEIETKVAQDLVRRKTIEESKKRKVLKITEEQPDRVLVYLLHDFCGIKAGQTFVMDSGFAAEKIRGGIMKEVKGKDPKVQAKEVSAITAGRKDKQIKKIDVNTKDDTITD